MALQLQIAFAAISIQFATSFKRIRRRLDLLKAALAESNIETPNYKEILILITDDAETGYYRRVKNKDGYFQVTSGIDPELSDEQLLEAVFAIARRVVLGCPDVESRKKDCEEVFDNVWPSIVDRTG